MWLNFSGGAIARDLHAERPAYFLRHATFLAVVAATHG
jgi:hypothetical protein